MGGLLLLFGILLVVSIRRSMSGEFQRAYALLMAEVTERRQAEEELRELTRGALAEMRALLLELRPTALSETTIGELLQQLGEATVGRARVPIDVDTEAGCSLPLEVKVAFYRIAQKALNNIVRHANAQHVEV